MTVRRLLLGLSGLLLGTAAQAHLLNMTRAQINVSADRQIEVHLSVDMTRAIGGPADYFRLSQVAEPLQDDTLALLFADMASAIELTQGGQIVPLHPVSAAMPSGLAEEAFFNPMSWPMAEVRLHGSLSTSGQPLQVRFGAGFRFEEPIALTLHDVSGDRSMTRWLVTGQASPSFALNPAAGEGAAAEAENREDAPGPTIVRYIRFGFLHILPLGLDHVLFVLGLYLGTRGLKALLLFVSSFTVAHSTTLILSSFGAVRLAATVVEPLIVLSIAWVAIENLLFGQVRRYRAAVVFAFGLLHGLGFASALRELGLPPTHFLTALLSFNVGVELGQLAVIAAALLLTGRFRSRTWYRTAVVMPGSAAIAVLALLWTAQWLFD